MNFLPGMNSGKSYATGREYKSFVRQTFRLGLFQTGRKNFRGVL